MHVTALLPVLAILATSAMARTSHPNAGARRSVNHRKVAVEHERAVEQVSGNVERREAGQSTPRDLGDMRKVKKRAQTNCRARTTGAAASSSTSTTATTTATAQADDTTTTTAATAATSSTKDGGKHGGNGSDNSATWSAAASSSTSSSSAAAAPTKGSSSTGSANGALTPNGIKAGISGGDAFSASQNHISWWYDWSADPSGHGAAGITPVAMLWGDGAQGDQDAGRLSAFKSLSQSPAYIMGFYEPDCSPPMSSAIDPQTASALWNSLIVPHRSNGGSVLLSPGMCKQADETWLQPFQSAIGASNMWDITAIHVNKNNMDGVKKDIDHYWNTYGKPIWVTEFACVDDSNGFTPCTDQGEINSYINQIVPLLEGDSRVYAYAYSNGEGLGDVWPMIVNGQLTESGQTYINAISAYH